MNSEDLQKRRNKLLADIDTAFEGVTREGGISWNQADAMDNYAAPEEQMAARSLDTEQSWQELVDDPKWRFGFGHANFCFLDAIGMRYYIAPAMKRNLLGGEGDGLLHTLNVGDEFREHRLQAFELLSEKQRNCVARFCQLMAEMEKNCGPVNWQTAFESHWHQYV